jgi:hypothetical protein
MAAREPVPDAENSAIVVAEVVSMLPESWPSTPPTEPGTPNPPPNQVQLAFDRIDSEAPNVRLDEETAATLRNELAAHREAIRRARTVAAYARGRHELDLTPGLVDTSLHESQNARTVVRLLAADAAIRAHDGDIDGALDSCAAILGVGRSIGDEPFIISGLVRVAMGGVAMKSARRVLAQGVPSDAALARLQSATLNDMGLPFLLQELRGERAILDEIIRRIRDEEIPISALSENGNPSDPVRPVAPWGKLWFDNQRAAGLEWMNQAVGIARQPSYKRAPLWKAWDADFARVRNSQIRAFLVLLPVLMIPAVESAVEAHVRYQSDLGSMAILLAAERHRGKTGEWPASIDALDPSILSNPLIDPFSGQPLRLERRDGQFLVHSIGPNLENERGAYEPKKWRRGGADDVGHGAWDVSHRGRQPQE